MDTSRRLQVASRSGFSVQLSVQVIERERFQHTRIEPLLKGGAESREFQLALFVQPQRFTLQGIAAWAAGIQSSFLTAIQADFIPLAPVTTDNFCLINPGKTLVTFVLPWPHTRFMFTAISVASLHSNGDWPDWALWRPSRSPRHWLSWRPEISLIRAHEVIEGRVRRDPEFVAGLLEEAVERLIANDPVTAQLLLRDIINGTVGFPAMSVATEIPEKSLMRMLSVKGNPQARNLFAIIDRLQAMNGIALEVCTRPSKRP